MEIVSRKQALEAGLTYHFNGKPCKHGHLAYRWTVNGTCFTCENAKRKSLEYKQQANTRNKKKRLYESETARKNRLTKHAKYQETYKQKLLSKYGTEKLKRRAAQKRQERLAANPMARRKALANCRAYQTRKLNATPKWADLEAIKQFYINAPPGTHVDHVIPLRGQNVCGLHVVANLQYLDPKLNQAKGNRLFV